MKFTAHATSIVGSESPGVWCQALVNDHLFLTVEIMGEQAATQGSQFLHQLQQVLKDQPQKTLTEFKTILKDLSASIGKIHYTAALIVNGNILLVATSGHIWIKRQNRHAKLIHGASVMSGRLQSGDILLLASSGFMEIFPKPEVARIFQQATYENMAEIIALKIRSQANCSVAAIVISLDQLGLETSGVPIWRKYKSKLMWPKIALPKIKMFNLKQIRPITLVIFTLCLLLMASIVFGIIKQNSQKNTLQFEQSLVEASHQYDEGVALIDLNPIRARELLKSAKNNVEKVLQQEKSQAEQKPAQALLEQINAGLSTSLRLYRQDPEIFFTLDLIRKNGEGSALVLDQDDCLILNQKNSALYLVNILSKAARVISNDALPIPGFSVDLEGANAYVLDDGISQISIPGGKLKTVIDSDKDWLQPKKLVVFSGNIYLLDTGSNQIWKYIKTETGYSAKQNYLLADTLVDLGKADDMTIDGSVWVVSQNQILKFTQGKQEVWRVKDIDEDFGTHLNIYTDEQSKNLYILDTDKKRVVVVDKEGIYLAQYRWDKDLKVSDLVVSETIKKILLLSGGTIYAINLK